MALSEGMSVMQIGSENSVLVNGTSNAVTDLNSRSSPPMARQTAQVHQKKHGARSVEVGGALEYKSLWSPAQPEIKKEEDKKFLLRL